VSGGTCCRPAQAGPGRRALRTLAWLLPSVLLALIPKCPACLAAWFAVITGAGIAATTASYVRSALVILCVGLAVLAWKRLRPPRNRPTTLAWMKSHQ